MSIPSRNVNETRPESELALADIVSMPLMVPSESSSGWTISRRTSSGEEDG